jgi:hypothetical protein
LFFEFDVENCRLFCIVLPRMTADVDLDESHRHSECDDGERR